MKKKHSVLNSFPRGRIVFFVTSNIHKFNEAREVLSQYGLATAMLRIAAVEIQDDSLENIAKVTAIEAVENCCLPIIVEDAGLFIEALNGFPGPYSSYVYRSIGTKGVLKLMENVERRDAHFHSVVAFSSPEEGPRCFHGKANGKISMKVRGEFGFGFDPIFETSEDRNRTFAEMRMPEKNTHSHRAEALQKFAKWYKSGSERRF